MSDPSRSWAVLDLTDEQANGFVHVVPWIGEDDGDVAGDHDPWLLCRCRPRVIRDLLDVPVISHTQPDWPGCDEASIRREMA